MSALFKIHRAAEVPVSGFTLSIFNMNTSVSPALQ